MVKLRLERKGKKHDPRYRLVAIQARSKRSGKALEYLGTYNPKAEPTVFEYNKERVEYWLSVGAQPTETVQYWLAKDGLVDKPEKTYQKEAGEKSKDRAKQKAEKAEAAKAEKAEAKAAKEESAEVEEKAEVAAEAEEK